MVHLRFAWKPLRIPPGWTIVRWMPNSATSWLMPSVNPSSPHFAAWYGLLTGVAI